MTEMQVYCVIFEDDEEGIEAANRTGIRAVSFGSTILRCGRCHYCFY